MDKPAPRPTNRLIHALSPYLLQHAHNPVDWYPWGPEALEKARIDNKPIFLSIGYAACHWCHVMEHEVFEAQAAAALLNEHFISIKVDREERPDIDEVYMQATLALNQGQGGWPMSVFLTPDGVPFYAATYIPREQFMRLVPALVDTWSTEPARIHAVSAQLREYLEQWAAGSAAAGGVPPRAVVDETARLMARHFDMTWGGLNSGGNKFPPTMSLELMLRSHARTPDAALSAAVEVTLDRMAAGGIYDHLGGGICRYSTDAQWLVPHFEKMLYDQALVSGIYLDAYQAMGHERYAAVARGILDYVLADLQSPDGGFYSTRDADSDGLEGKFYIWTVEELQTALGPDDAALFAACYGVTAAGNWDERFGHAPPGPKNILHLPQPLDQAARQHGLTPAALEERLSPMRATLAAVRSARTPPGLDDKILTAWNGLMCASLSKAARVLDEPRYAAASGRSLQFVLDRMRRDGRLLRTARGDQSQGFAYLTDYAFLIEALLNQYEATFETHWLLTALELTDSCRTHHHDAKGGAFYFIAHDAEPLIARTKNPRDGAIPSGNSVHAANLLRLAVYFNRTDLRNDAEAIFRAFAAPLAETPHAFERLLCALDLYYDKPREIVITGSETEAGAALLRTVYGCYLPNKIVAAAPVPSGLAEQVPLLKGKDLIKGQPAAFVCENYRCRAPVLTPEALQQALAQPAAKSPQGPVP